MTLLALGRCQAFKFIFRQTPIGSLDTMIAAHALSQHAMPVTNNTREFAKVPGLQLDNWVAAP